MSDDPLNLSVGPPPVPDVDLAMPTGDPFAPADALDPLGVVDVDGAGAGVLAYVDEAKVRRILSTLGEGLHKVLGDDAVPDHWRFTDRELDTLAPIITGWAQRNARLAAAVEKSDYVTVAATLGMFGWRNVQDGVRAANHRELDGPLAPTTTATTEAPTHALDRQAAAPQGLGAPVGGAAAGEAADEREWVGPAATGPAAFAPPGPGAYPAGGGAR